MESPTDENTTHDPDDGPAELEIIGSHMLKSVPVYESTGRMLSSLAATAIEHADRNPEDHDAQGIAAILTAVEHAHRNPDDDDTEAKMFRDAVGKLNARNPSHSSGLVSKAIDYMRKPFRGPATPAQQADRLCSVVAFHLANEAKLKQVVDKFVARLRTIAPDVAKHTCVPTLAQVPEDEWRGSDAKAEAEFAVEGAIAEILETTDAKTITKAALRALGCPDKMVQNFYRKKS